MAMWFNWSPVSPIIQKYSDDGTRELCTAKINVSEVGDFCLSLIGTEHRIELIRVATMDSDGNLSPRQVEIVERLVDHAVSVIRLTHDRDASLVKIGDSSLSFGAHDVNGRPSLSLEITDIISPLNPWLLKISEMFLFTASVIDRYLSCWPTLVFHIFHCNIGISQSIKYLNWNFGRRGVG